MSNQRIQSRSSRTASYTCFSRGCATREKDPRFRGPDYLAEKMFPLPAKIVLNVEFARQFMMRKMFPPGIHEYVYSRTRIMDTVFKEALNAKLPQIILLGAGFDTRAMRFTDRNQSTRIFELDAPTTQQAKLDVIKRKKIPIPGEVVFASIDFDKQSLFDVLSATGYKTGQKNLFLWEGVTMYLTPPAVDATLEFIQQTSASGSLVAFDYIYASVLRRENRLYGEEDIYKNVSDAGEAWTFGLEEGEISSFLQNRGFELVDHFSPDRMEKLFLSEPDGTLHGRVNGTHCLAIASVK